MSKNNHIKYWKIILIFCCISFFSKGQSIIVDNIGDGEIEIKKEILVYFDSSNATHPSQFSLDKFQPLASLSEKTEYPQKSLNTWILLEFENNSTHEITSNFHPGFFNYLEVFIQNENKEWVSKINGYHVYKSERATLYENIFPIKIAPTGKSRILFQFDKTFTKESLHFQLISNYQLLANPPLNVRMPFTFALINAFFFGGLLFVIAFSLIQYFQVKEKSYLYYSAYLMSMVLFYLIRFEMWYPEVSVLFSFFAPYLDHLDTPISVLIYTTYTLFILHFLDIKKGSPRDYKILMACIVGFLVYIIIDKIFWAIGGFPLSIKMFAIVRIIFLPLGLFYVIYLIYKNKSPLTIYILVGSLFLMVSAIAGLLMTIFYQDDGTKSIWTFPILYVMIGAIGEVIFFSAGLGYKNRLEIENKNKAILKAMRSQMNPHFIFNGLNSIKQLIYEKEDRSAIRYLTRFSKLFRKVLVNSDKDLVTLDEELKMCKVFLEIESLRFKGKFEYEIQVADNVDLTMVDIPPMTIQPHIENAIWHGLLPKEKDCKLNIIIENKGNFVKCLIDDNGVGRAASDNFKNQSSINKESFGIKLSTERLSYNNIRLKIIDKMNDNGEPLGTQVKITIPS